MIINSKAAIKRLPIGTKLVLVNTLVGPCNKPRTVKAVNSVRVTMETEEGKESSLYLDIEGTTVEPTENGFRIMAVTAINKMPIVSAEYVFASSAKGGAL